MGGGRWMDQRVSVASLEPTRYGMEEEGEVKRREVGVKVAMPSGPRREDTPKRSYWRRWSGIIYASQGGRVGRMRWPPSVATMGSPLPACENVRGGTGRGEKRWRRWGSVDARISMEEAPESAKRLWGGIDADASTR